VGFNNFTLHAYNSPHQAYLQIASEVGIPALFVYMSLLGSAIWAAARAWRRSSASGFAIVEATSRGVLCCLLCVTVQGFTTGLAHRELVHVFVALAYCVDRLSGSSDASESLQSESISEPQVALNEVASSA